MCERLTNQRHKPGHKAQSPSRDKAEGRRLKFIFFLPSSGRGVRPEVSSSLQAASLPFLLFCRTALPFGGFDKGSKLLTFELPELNISVEEPEPLPSLQADIRSRPSFNRTPIGWVCNEDNTHIHMDLDNIPFDGETDDL